MVEETVPGHWYFTVTCIRCAETFAFREAPPEDEEPVMKVGSAKVTCQLCGYSDTYPPAEISRQQAE